MTYLVADIGKSHVRVALANPDGGLSEIRTEVSRYGEGSDTLLAQATRLGRTLIHEAGVQTGAAGVGIPAIVDARRGRLITSGFMPEWSGLQAAKLFQEAWGLPTAVENNIRTAALGEAQYGAGRGHRTVVYVTISVGFGHATVVDGQLWNGANNLAGQVGFTKLTPSRSFNQLLSGSGLLAAGAKYLGSGIAVRDIFNAAERGAEGPRLLIDRAVQGLGQYLALMQTTVDPDLFVFGGAIAREQPEFLRKGAAASLEYLGVPHRQILPGGVRIQEAALSGNAGLIGAGVLADQISRQVAKAGSSG